ncbi:putative NOT transcription complex subunit VIP2 [Hordeum vulgare]|nr:putative NOT transcription complex subunit VIP2 [Hordeum vulgare]
MKGWGANVGRDIRLRKGALLLQIQCMDMRADVSGLSADDWALRYSLEDELLEIYKKEETYRRERGSFSWVLFRDANAAYFQAIANGCRRRCTIPLLWHGDRLIQEPGEIRDHVDEFYTELFAARPRSGVALDESIWDIRQRVSPAENRALLAPFAEVVVTAIIKGTNPSSAPAPDGLPFRFFQTF